MVTQRSVLHLAKHLHQQPQKARGLRTQRAQQLAALCRLVSAERRHLDCLFWRCCHLSCRAWLLSLFSVWLNSCLLCS